MSFEREAELEAPISFILEKSASISLRASRSDGTALLKIGRSTCEIVLEPGHVKSLSEQLPDVLAALDQAVDADTACETAKAITERTVNASEGARSVAVEAAEVGLDELAADAETAAEWARMCVYVVDGAVRTVREATRAADRAADISYRAATKIEAELVRLRDPALLDTQDSQ